MAISNVAISPVTTPVTLFSSTGNNAITTIMICNIVDYNPASPSANISYLDLHVVPSGGGPTTTNQIVNGLPVAAGETVTFDTEKIVLENGDSIVAISGTSANLVATVSSLSVD